MDSDDDPPPDRETYSPIRYTGAGAIGWTLLLLFGLGRNSPKLQSCLFLIAIFLLCLPELHRSWFVYRTLRDENSGSICNRRLQRRQMTAAFIRHAVPTMVLVFSYGKLWSLDDIGFHLQNGWITACLAGLILVGVFRKVEQVLIVHVNPRLEWTEPNIAVLRSNLPRGKTLNVINGIHTALISPAYEEIVYRGFFVFYVGELFDSKLLGFALGLVLCILLHLYQGVQNIASNSLFFLITFLLLYSPGGLLAVYVFHAACNLHYLILLRGQAQWYLQKLRSQRGSTTNEIPVESP